MKITDYRRSTIGLVLGTASNSLAIGGVAASSNAPPGAGLIIVATSSNTFEWRNALAFGSNTNDVSSTGTMGASSSNTRADHVHRGVHLITAAGSNAMYGDINLVAGTGMGITAAGNAVTFASTGTGADHGALTGLADDDHSAYALAYGGGEEMVSAHGSMGATETFAPASGNWHTGTFNAACTFTFTGPTAATGCSLMLELTQDGTGGWAVTLPASFANKAALEAAQVTTASTVSFLLAWTRDGGTTWYGAWVGAGLSAADFATPTIALGTAAAAGVATTVVRSDSTIAAFDATVPVTQAFSDAAATGSAAFAARRDHRHGMPALETAGHWEILMAGGISSPPEPLENGDGSDWLYVWVS